MSSKLSKNNKADASDTNLLMESEAGATAASQVAADDPHKVEKLTKAGRDLDPDEGTE